jgi:hypothetical protein
VYIQDDKHKAIVYVKIKGMELGKDVLDQSIRQVFEGEIYLDEDCLLPLEDDYINIYKSPRSKKDFVYVIERKYAKDFIVGVKIIDYVFVE